MIPSFDHNYVLPPYAGDNPTHRPIQWNLYFIFQKYIKLIQSTFSLLNLIIYRILM